MYKTFTISYKITYRICTTESTELNFILHLLPFKIYKLTMKYRRLSTFYTHRSAKLHREFSNIHTQNRISNNRETFIIVTTVAFQIEAKAPFVQVLSDVTLISHPPNVIYRNRSEQFDVNIWKLYSHVHCIIQHIIYEFIQELAELYGGRASTILRSAAVSRVENGD